MDVNCAIQNALTQLV